LDRQQVVDVSLDVLQRDGYEALSMRRLAAELYVSLPTVYSAIGSRAELLGHLLEAALRRFVAGSSSPSEYEEHQVGGSFQWFAERPWLLRIAGELTPEERRRVWSALEELPNGPVRRVGPLVHVIELLNDLVDDHELDPAYAGRVGVAVLDALGRAATAKVRVEAS
jgi:AcrR family transcriptional regulator